MAYFMYSIIRNATQTRIKNIYHDGSLYWGNNGLLIQGRIQDFHEGGGGAKDVRAHITSANLKVPYGVFLDALSCYLSRVCVCVGGGGCCCIPVWIRNCYGINDSDKPSCFYSHLMKVMASNSDNGTDGIAYRLLLVSDDGENFFRIDGVTGVISVVNYGIDAETISRYTLVVEAIDDRWTYARYIGHIFDIQSCIFAQYFVGLMCMLFLLFSNQDK